MRKTMTKKQEGNKLTVCTEEGLALTGLDSKQITCSGKQCSRQISNQFGSTTNLFITPNSIQVSLL